MGPQGRLKFPRRSIVANPTSSVLSSFKHTETPPPDYTLVLVDALIPYFYAWPYTGLLAFRLR